MASTAAADEAAERRCRARALLDATTPGRSLAVGRCKLALDTFRSDPAGAGLSEARTLLGDALVCDHVHHPAIYRAWIAVELEAGAGAGTANACIRELFERWRTWYLRGTTAKNQDDEGGFWCRYMDFELRHGTPAAARRVAERAVAACPRDPAVHARCAAAELRLGCPDRAAAVLLRALDGIFAAADAGAREWMEQEVKAYSDSLRRHGTWGGRLRGLLPSLCRRRLSRPPAPGYELLAVA